MIRLRWWLAAAGTAIAFGGAALASGLAAAEYHAQAVLVIGRGVGPLAPGQVGVKETASAAELVDSHLIAADVIANLHLRGTTAALLDRIDARAVSPGLVRVTARDKRALVAEQIAQEVTLVYPRLLRARFKGAHALSATVWDPARVVARPDRAWGTSLGAAAGASAFLWLLAFAPSLRRPRIRLPKLPERRPKPQAPPATPATPSPPVEPPPPAPPVAVVPAVANGAHGFNLVELESLVDAARERYPDRVDEWQAYVFYLRDYAEIDGSLPENFDPLVEDVFADLLTTRR